MRQPPIVMAESVRAALDGHQPVVALESTVITHGLPHPQNLEIMRELEELLRGAGVVPATIMVLEGQARIGLEPRDIPSLATRLAGGEQLLKLGWRDLALALAKGGSGGTTVSATLALAAQAGIEVFATGGIGGVHRGWETTLDISSDLAALSRFPVAVVSAGCKAILDVSATLEQLETLAVPVLGWRTNRFPLFYTSDSGYAIDRVDTAEQFASFWSAHRALGGSGALIANPIPEADSLPAEMITPAIEQALREAKARKISGKALTPFLLDYLARTTKAVSVQANLALLRNNVRLAAELALALREKGE